MRKRALAIGIAVAALLVAVLATGPLGTNGPGVPPGESDAETPDREGAPARADRQDAELTGRVWRAGTPSAARVEIWSEGSDDPAPRDRIAATDAGSNGAFRLRNLPVGSYRVLATAPDGASGSSVVEIRLPSQRIAIDLTIPSGPHTLLGRVVHEDGRPFRGFVTLTPTGFGRFAYGAPPLETDEEGRFTARWLEAGTVRVRCATGGDFRYAGRVVRVPHEGEFLIVVDRGTVELTGRVTTEENGSPVAGATVEAYGDTGQNRATHVRARTDDAGRFRVRVPPYRRKVTVRADGFSPVERDVERDEKHVEIRIARHGSIDGRVLAAEDRTPLAGVPVRWVPLDPWHILDGGRVVSDGSGRFAIPDLPVGRVMVWVAGGGRISPGLNVVEDDGANPLVVTIAPGAEKRVDLLAIRAVRVRGRVIDARGGAVSGVPVRASRRREVDLLSKHPTETLSGPDGSFRFDGLAPDIPYSLEATPPGRAPVESHVVEGAAGDVIDVTIEVPSADTPPRWLDVSVREMESGDPIGRASVFAGARGGWTAANGRARIGPLKPGPISVWVFHADYALLKNRPTVPESATGLIPVTVRLRRGLAIAGRVHLPDGQPLENGTVWVKSADAEADAPDRTDIGIVTAGGRFRAGGLLAGRYKIRIGGTHDDGGYWANAVAEAGEEDLVLTAERYIGEEERPLILKVVDPEGRPVAGADAEIRYQGGGRDWSNDFPVVAGRGEYDFYTSEGSVTISVYGAKSLSGARLPLGAVLLGPMPLTEGEITVRLSKEKTITGVIRDADGAPVAGVRVTAAPVHKEEHDFSGDHGDAFSDADGAFRIGGLGELDYLVDVDAPREFLGIEPVPAKAGATGLEIRLTRGGSFRITVVDPAGDPVSGAMITLGVYEHRAFTHRDGTATIRGLGPGSGDLLKVSPPAGRTDLVGVAISDWRPRDETIALEPGLWISGRVLDVDGQPAVGATVRSLSRDISLHTRDIPDDGSFRIGPFPAGRVVLSVGWPGQPHTEDRMEAVEAGREDVVLTADSGRTLTLRILNWSATYGPARARVSGVSGTRWTVVESDGTAPFRGLAPTGDRSVWIGPVGDGLFLRKTVPADEESVEARLVRGGTVEGRITWPAGAREPAVQIDGVGFSMEGAVEEDGSFRFVGLPDEECAVTASVAIDGRRVEEHVWTRPGERVEIELEAEDR